MFENLRTFVKLLPNFKEIENILQNDSQAKYILQKSFKFFENIGSTSGHLDAAEAEETSYLVLALVDKCWERIHTGHFSEVPLKTRQIYALACYFKVEDTLCSVQQIEKCSQILDEAILIGCAQNLFGNNAKLLEQLQQFFDSRLDLISALALPVIVDAPRFVKKCDIQQLSKPSVEEFNKKCFISLKPGLLLDAIQHWPALEKWRDLNYIMKLAGNRTVPIEIGSNYTTNEWSQQLMKVKDFLRKQFIDNSKDVTPNVEYLAQHELFEQIPQLKKDFSLPDYCTLGENLTDVDIKAWLGPAGTISPMHYDPKHNLLCQVFGSKYIILAAPQDTNNLYAHDSEFLSNTSQINAESLDLERFPLAGRVKFYHLYLQTGDCLYMPPKWWHFVKSLSPSFSVSFWWE